MHLICPFYTETVDVQEPRTTSSADNISNTTLMVRYAEHIFRNSHNSSFYTIYVSLKLTNQNVQYNVKNLENAVEPEK